jgi:hypothetical protein
MTRTINRHAAIASTGAYEQGGSCLGPLFAAMMVDCNHTVGQIVDSSVG